MTHAIIVKHISVIYLLPLLLTFFARVTHEVSISFSCSPSCHFHWTPRLGCPTDVLSTSIRRATSKWCLCCACLNITISENIILDFRLIEEFMLLANMAVARKIQRAFPETSLLRRHPKPKQRCADILVTYSSYPVCRMHVHTIRTDLWYHDLRIGYFVRINGNQSYCIGC